MIKISCIIAAYNEAPRIGTVLSAVQHHPLIDETLVVNDGSADNTAAVVNQYTGVRLITNGTNKGKSFSVSRGITEARNEYLMMLDADLSGITPQNITDLATPIISGIADVTMTLRGNSLGIYKLLGIDFYSGERIFSKKLLEGQLDTIAKLPGFALETRLNRLIIDRHLRVRIVRWDNVTNTRKSNKIGPIQGRLAELKMIRQILHIASIHDIIRQNYKLRKLTILKKD